MPELNPTEPEVVKAVQAEIKKLGDNTKANYDELRKAHESLKGLIESSEGKFDALVKEQITKLTEDITTRQTAMDAKAVEIQKELDTKLKELATNRIDALETAMKRPGGAGAETMSAEEAAQEMKDAKDLQISAIAVSGKSEKGASYNLVKDLKVDVEMLRNYKKGFEAFVRTDERLATPETVKALSVGIDPDGGYTVTPTMSNRVVQRLYEIDPLRQLASVETISTNAIEWLVDYDQAGSGWEGETSAGSETDTPKIFKKRIPVHVEYAKPRATQTLLEDSAINIENWLGDHVARRFLRLEGGAFVSGDGVGKPRGFLTYGDYDTAGTDQWGRIERTNMGAAAALTADGFIDVKYSLIEQYLQRATWMMNRLTVAAAMKLKDGQGQYIWKPGLKEDMNSTLLG
ncbi:MAG: phage major capsid protein, partial [Desulfobacterales bacterium]